MKWEKSVSPIADWIVKPFSQPIIRMRNRNTLWITERENEWRKKKLNNTWTSAFAIEGLRVITKQRKCVTDHADWNEFKLNFIYTQFIRSKVDYIASELLAEFKRAKDVLQIVSNLHSHLMRWKSILVNRTALCQHIQPTALVIINENR